jgi:hypothetical protein
MYWDIILFDQRKTCQVSTLIPINDPQAASRIQQHTPRAPKTGLLARQQILMHTAHAAPAAPIARGPGIGCIVLCADAARNVE